MSLCICVTLPMRSWSQRMSRRAGPASPHLAPTLPAGLSSLFTPLRLHTISSATFTYLVYSFQLHCPPSPYPYPGAIYHPQARLPLKVTGTSGNLV